MEKNLLPRILNEKSFLHSVHALQRTTELIPMYVPELTFFRNTSNILFRSAALNFEFEFSIISPVVL